MGPLFMSVKKSNSELYCRTFYEYNVIRRDG